MRRWNDRRPHADSARRRQAGYALLEFVVAFTILSVFLATILAALSVALRSDKQAEFAMTAVSIAKSRLAAAGVEFPLRPGTTGSTLDNGYAWRATMRPYAAAVLETGLRIEGYWIEVTVSSHAGRSLSLSAVKITAAPVASEVRR
jgi:general secretion pathway protein I